MTQTLVTIGIPTYNVGRFVALSIKSVLAQTYTNFELIITDDGSTDNTVEEIEKFKDPRIKLIVDGENHGISYRLNLQIDMAKGDIFVRTDGYELYNGLKCVLDNPSIINEWKASVEKNKYKFAQEYRAKRLYKILGL